MTKPKQDGDIYLNMMFAQMGLILALIAFVGTFIVKQGNYVEKNTIEHANIYKEMTKDSSWTRWIHRNQIVPAYELSYNNRDEIASVNRKLNSIDSNLVVQGYNIKRIFLYLRSDRDGHKAFQD
jgi:hypothetical protein